MDIEKLKRATQVCLMAAGLTLFWVLLFWALTRPAHAYTNEEAVNAIIGEAAGEPFIGQVSVGEVIRRRGSLRGVYGATAKRTHTKIEIATARRAWAASEASCYVPGAMGWGNAADIKKFQKTKWFKNCKIVKQIAHHYFWAPSRARGK